MFLPQLSCISLLQKINNGLIGVLGKLRRNSVPNLYKEILVAKLEIH
jgi:hypothetical protein